MNKCLWLCLMLLFSCDGADKMLDTSKSLQALFTAIPSSQSGIHFSNQLTENLATGENILDFDFFFNGSGLAIADFDNDGLEDIFFAGNQVENKIYKNEGNMKFTDMTAHAKINAPSKAWSNGVNCADVNQDGLLDIYVSQGGPYGPEKRGNLLLINQGDFTFEEQAAKYGLQDNGISTQSAFFDYDNDGDLDCFVMNESPLIGFDPVSFYSLINSHSSTLLTSSSSQLYRNDNGQFINVTEDANLLHPSFGLGLCISDINNDNWLDIYVANDYYIPDAVYINDQKGGFTDNVKKIMNQSSFYSMGLDIADINNDGHQDIYALDMASVDHVKSKTLMASMNVANFDLLTKDFDFPYQYMFNALQLNNGTDQFNNIAHLSGTAKTDWSWACLIEDFDLDGQKEIFVSNGYRKYARDNDFQNRVLALKEKYKNQEIPLSEKERLYKTIPSEKLPNVFFKQKSPLQFENIADKVGLDKPSFSNGAAYADLDNDGDLDLVINNIDEEAFVYENNAQGKEHNFLKVKLKSNSSETFAKLKIYFGDQIQMAESKRVRGYLSSQPSDIVFGLGKANQIDSLIVNWPNGKRQKIVDLSSNQTLTLQQKDATVIEVKHNTSDKTFSKTNSIIPNYKHQESGYNDFQLETLLPYKQSVTGPKIRVLEDKNIFVGGSASAPASIFDWSGNVVAKFDTGEAEMVDGLFFDLENDGDQDVYLIAGGNEQETTSSAYLDQLWINKEGKFIKSETVPKNKISSSGKTGLVLDFDKNGYEDLIICNRIIPKQYPAHAPSTILKNDNGKLINATGDIASDLTSFGIINDIVAVDFNEDGWEDFIVVGEWTGVGVFQNNQGKFENVSALFGLEEILGWWFSITPTDFNNDGKTDFVIGNLGLNSKYKASKEKPLLIYGHDFDQNGSYDQVLSYTYKGKEVPLRGRQCSSEQMPFIAEKFKTYDAFANANLQDVYGSALEDATTKKANEFASILLINNGKGFDIKALPIEAQFSPILDGVSVDIDKNGFDDVILIGNIYETEVETPRLDFTDAAILLSDGKSYKYSVELSSQIKIAGNSKSIELVKDGSEKKKILIGVNGESIREYTIVN